MSEEKALVTQEPFSLVPHSLAEAMEYAKLIASTDLVPQSYRNKPGDVLIAVQMGAELGVSPLQSLQNIAVINGRPTMWGDMVAGLVQGSGLLESMGETWHAESQTATCIVQRKGRPEAVTRTFSMADAKRAGLDKKQTYQQYPQRMCQMRARSWALRDEFADVLKGIAVREEVDDYPAPRTVRMPEPLKLAEKVEEFLNSELDTVETVLAQAAKTQTAKPPVETHEWRGFLSEVQVETGETVKVLKSGEEKAIPWTVYRPCDKDFKPIAGTFSETMAGEMRECAKNGDEVVIGYQIAAKGNKIVSFRPASIEEANEGADPRG